MTNQEAIETLRANYPDACYEQLREAVDAAIEALKAQDATGDTISRQAVIDALEKVADLYYYNEAWNYAIGRAEMEIEKLSSVQQEPPWIPCSERMPEKNGWYICSIKGENVNALYYTGKTWIDNVRKHMFELYDITSKLTGEKISPEKESVYWDGWVIAWMPLPESYKGDK